MNVLMLSSSRAGDEPYLATAKPMILEHLSSVQHALFIPYAGVSVSLDQYTRLVADTLPELEVSGLHQTSSPVEAVMNAQAILVGGGNTFNLLNELYRQDLMQALKQRVTEGMPYVGWSAGSNICGNSIRTTNDMPIIQPPSFEALNFVPFQLNPHYTDYQPPGHAGETRAQRIKEFCTLNPTMPVVGIREGTALLLKDNKLKLKGKLDGVLFKGDNQDVIAAGADLSYLLKTS